MSTQAPPARISLLRALDAPYIVVLRRKPSRVFHVLRWNTQTDVLEPGSWFRGKIYDYKSDVSHDGEWLVYFAKGSDGINWTGISRLPFLKTVAHNPQDHTWGGGGWWGECLTLVTHWPENPEDLPIRIVSDRHLTDCEHDSLFQRRKSLEWQPVPGTEDPVYQVPDYEFSHPTADYTLYQHQEKTGPYSSADRFHLRSKTLADPLDKKVDSAQVDSIGNLVFSRAGVLYRYSPDDLQRGAPGSVHDLEPLTHPRPATD